MSRSLETLAFAVIGLKESPSVISPASTRAFIPDGVTNPAPPASRNFCALIKTSWTRAISIVGTTGACSAPTACSSLPTGACSGVSSIVGTTVACTCAAACSAAISSNNFVTLSFVSLGALDSSLNLFSCFITLGSVMGRPTISLGLAVRKGDLSLIPKSSSSLVVITVGVVTGVTPKSLSASASIAA